MLGKSSLAEERPRWKAPSLKSALPEEHPCWRAASLKSGLAEEHPHWRAHSLMSALAEEPTRWRAHSLKSALNWKWSSVALMLLKGLTSPSFFKVKTQLIWRQVLLSTTLLNKIHSLLLNRTLWSKSTIVQELGRKETCLNSCNQLYGWVNNKSALPYWTFQGFILHDLNTK